MQFTRVARLKGTSPFLDPTQRFVATRSGSTKILIYDAQDDYAERAELKVRSARDVVAISPEGARGLLLQDRRIALVGAEGIIVERAIPAAPKIGGAPPPAGKSWPSMNRCGSAALFSADGAIFQCGHDEAGRGHLSLLDGETLETIATHTQLGAPERGEDPFRWSEVYLIADPCEANAVLLMENAGDSLGSVGHWAHADGALVDQDSAGLTRAVMQHVDSHFMRGIHRTAKGDLLFLDRDGGLHHLGPDRRPATKALYTFNRLDGLPPPLRFSQTDWNEITDLHGYAAYQAVLPISREVGRFHEIVGAFVWDPAARSLLTVPGPRPRYRFDQLWSVGRHFGSCGRSFTELWDLR